jgi:phosphatidylethanolamine-binding protein (PEBP) family uncharacterized protein
MTMLLRVAAVAAVMMAIGAVDMAHLAVAMSLDFSWAGVAGCTAKPPAFMLSDVPEGTSRLAFSMVDLNLPSFPHGGGTIDYRGSDQVAAASFAYQGPCPPKGQRHNYRWTVKALDAAGKTLATTSAEKRFPPR